MSNYVTSQDIVNAVLSNAGELTDGTSGYQADALTYVNLAYKGVLTGGNIFGIDVAEPWTWAIAKKPIVLTLQPDIESIGVTTTQFSYNITLSAIPKDVTGANISLAGWWVNIDSRDEWFRITSHTSGTTVAQIDVPYTEQSLVAANSMFVLLDYDLIDDSVVVDQYSNQFTFSELSGTFFTANLTAGIYTPAGFATMVTAAMTSVGTQTYVGAWNETTRLFTWSAPAVFNFNFVTKSSMQATSASDLMGLDLLDFTGLNSYVSGYPLNAINRLTSPMLTYRRTSTPWAGPKNEGKIYEISFNTFVREYPLTMMRAGTPEKYCITKVSPTGITSVRMNSFMYQLPTKVEVGYIPKRRALQFNSVSVPAIPEEHRTYLVDAATARLMHDKVDSRRVEREGLAKAGLQALVHSHRKSLSLAGINYGKLVARPGQTQRNWRWWQIT